MGTNAFVTLLRKPGVRSCIATFAIVAQHRQMSRSLRIEFDGAFYHVMARGNAREPIFRDDEDRQAFVDGLWHSAERFDW